MSIEKDGLTFDNAKEAREYFKRNPTETRAWKKSLIKALCKSMEIGFLDKLERLPANWDGQEIRTWMAETWARETWMGRWKERDRKRLKKFKNDCYTNNL